jgi:hypothetical protein
VAFEGNQFAVESLEKRMVLITKDVGKLDDRASSWEKKVRNRLVFYRGCICSR